MKIPNIELPVYMRVGDGEEHEIGRLSLAATTSELGGGDGVLAVWISLERTGPALAGLLREVADKVERQERPALSGS